jgi:hypothetical protein
MGVIVKPLNLNNRQVKRVDRIEESNGTYEGRARRVANRIDARRDARGAENPRLAKAIAERRSMAQPMKKGGKIIKKAQNGIVKSLKKAGADLKQADRDYKSSDSLRKLPITGKTLKEKLENSKTNRAKADSLYKVAKKREAGEMKKGGKIIKKAQNGKKTSFGMLSVKAGVDNNPSATFADKIAGAKKKAMSGMEMMKMGGKAAKQAAIAIAMKKAGKTPKKKMLYGGEAASMVPKKKMKSGGTVSMQLGSYKDIIGKNYKGKNTKAVGLTKAKYGKSVMKMGGKCKNGC